VHGVQLPSPAFSDEELRRMFVWTVCLPKLQHPDIYGAALLGCGSSSSKFDQSADMWSVGATIYHIASGQVPFQPRGGRTNRQAMYVDVLLLLDYAVTIFYFDNHWL
jgi:serine/threonine protein kinase